MPGTTVDAWISLAGEEGEASPELGSDAGHRVSTATRVTIVADHEIQPAMERRPEAREEEGAHSSRPSASGSRIRRGPAPRREDPTGSRASSWTCSPLGLQGLACVMEADRPALQDRAASCSKGCAPPIEPRCARLYTARREALGSLEAPGGGGPPSPYRHEPAGTGVPGMSSGDLQRLQELSARLLEEEAREAVSGHPGRGADGPLPT